MRFLFFCMACLFMQQGLLADELGSASTSFELTFNTSNFLVAFGENVDDTVNELFSGNASSSAGSVFGNMGDDPPGFAPGEFIGASTFANGDAFGTVSSLGVFTTSAIQQSQLRVLNPLPSEAFFTVSGLYDLQVSAISNEPLPGFTLSDAIFEVENDGVLIFSRTLSSDTGLGGGTFQDMDNFSFDVSVAGNSVVTLGLTSTSSTSGESFETISVPEPTISA